MDWIGDLRTLGWRLRAGWRATIGAILLVSTASAQLTTALQVRSLTPSEAEEGRKVKLRAVVTYNDSPGTVFVQDATAGTFFRPGGVVTLEPGDIVEIAGQTHAALYVPGIAQSTFQLVSKGPPVEALPVSYADLVSGRLHYHWVSVEGVVRAVDSVDDGRVVLRISLGPQTIEAFLRVSLTDAPVHVDSRVRLRGLASGHINQRRQLVRPYLQLAGWQDVDEIEPAPTEESMRLASTADVLTFNAAGHSGRRVRLRGVVLAAFPGGRLFLRDGQGALAVQLKRMDGNVTVGEQVEVAGFPEMGRFSASLADADVRSRAPGERPSPVELAVPLLFQRGFDGELVTVTAIVTDWIRESGDVVLILREADRRVQARIPGAATGPEVGARVRVTGVSQVESFVARPYHSIPRAVSLHARGPEDVQVVQEPPWWTVRRLMIALAGVMGLVVLGAGWILVLRRQVRRQTETIRHRIEREASFEERQRLAREFHDTLEQDLTGVSLQLSTAAARHFDDKGRGLVDASRHLVERLQRETRVLVSDLRESEHGPLGPVDLAACLHAIARERAVEGGPRLEVAVPEASMAVPAAVAYHLRMIVQESITNALKHARASVIRLGLERRGGRLVLKIQDDGVGFDPSEATLGKRGHFGCMGIRERCLKIGAVVSWRSAPGQGTTVEISLDPEEGPSPASS